MDGLSDVFSMRGCQRPRSSIRKRSYFRVLDAESSDDESNSIRSGGTDPHPEPDNDTVISPESEYEAEDDGAGTETSIGEPIDELESEYEDDGAGTETSIGEPIDEEAELEDKAGEPIDEYEEEAEPEPIDEFEVSGDKPNPNPNPNPWIAECDFGTAFLKYPVYTTNQRVNPQPAQEPDPGWLNRDQPAQPLIRASWAGDFAIHSSRAEAPARCGGVKACVSAKACAQARVAVERLPAEVRWEKVPKYSVWPKSFERWGPTDNNIAVYFFPTLTRHEAAYDSLVMELVRDDRALKTTLAGAQLLLFTSVELPPLFTRFQGKLYLWGVFRGNRPQL